VERQHVAYLLIALLVLACVIWVGYMRHNTRDRKMSRQRTRERGHRDKRRNDES